MTSARDAPGLRYRPELSAGASGAGSEAKRKPPPQCRWEALKRPFTARWVACLHASGMVKTRRPGQGCRSFQKVVPGRTWQRRFILNYTAKLNRYIGNATEKVDLNDRLHAHGLSIRPPPGRGSRRGRRLLPQPGRELLAKGRHHSRDHLVHLLAAERALVRPIYKRKCN